MLKSTTATFALILSGLRCIGAAGAAKPADQPRTMDDVIERVIKKENQLNQDIRKYSPLVETYIQNQRSDKNLGSVPAGDKYFLGRADLRNGVALVSLTDTGKGGKPFVQIGNFFSPALRYLPNGFLQMIFIDTNGFDTQHYKFDYIRREFLGEVRCLMFDVAPVGKSSKGQFVGRIWVEDLDYNIVRVNGAYAGSTDTSWYFHFDSWRTNVRPGLWLPSFVFSEENDLQFGLTKGISFKAQTRLWGYNLGHAAQEQELANILIETPVQDESKTGNDLSPVQAQRAWDRQAEDNASDRLERIGLLAPKGEIDKILETVVNNLEVTNHLDLQPEVRCRVMMTTTFESFTIGHTIVLSRGLVDVLPDEASLAVIIAHELGHVILGHRVDSKYAFFDQVLIDDKETFRHFGFARSADEEHAASSKALELLNNSPYTKQLGVAGLFFAALETRQKEIPHLINPHLGNRVPVIADLKSTATSDPTQNLKLIVALPIGGRVKLDSWDDKLELIKAKPLGAIAEREKMPFEVTPFMPYLTRIGDEAAKPRAAMVEDKLSLDQQKLK